MNKIHYRAAGYEYPDDASSKAVFDRANAELYNLSLWRTATPDLSRWFILVLLADDANDRGFDWGSGVPFTPNAEQIDFMAARRAERGLRAVITGRNHETLHYEPEQAPRVPGGRGARSAA